MGLSTSCDTRWQGRLRPYLIAFTIKNLLIIPFVILIIVEGVLYKKWRNQGVGSTVDESYGPQNYWLRIGIYLCLDSIMTLVIAYFLHVNKWHPVAALVTGILWFGLWFCGLMFNILIVWSNEIWFENMDQWARLGYAEAGFQGVFATVYLVMMVCAARAVHTWRMAKKRGQAEVELETELETKGGSERLSVSV